MRTHRCRRGFSTPTVSASPEWSAPSSSVSGCPVAVIVSAARLSVDTFDEVGPPQDTTGTYCVDIDFDASMRRTTSSAVVVGVDAIEEIRDVTVSNCIIRSANRGLSVNLDPAGSFSNVVFANCIVETRRHEEHFWGAAEPIYVSCGPWQAVTDFVQLRSASCWRAVVL